MPNLVGIGLSQVPTNSMLGGLAYQDPEHASIKDLDLKNLSQINSEISDTAVDVFVYDTRKDSDGGAWRKRTQHTSWYNETLGTETRGTRKEFPAVAVIVIERQKIRIYDGDDPDLPMWMVFEINQYTNGGNLSYTPFGIGHVASVPHNSVSLSSVHMLNGLLFIGGNRDTNAASVHAAYDINFISEVMHEYLHYPTSATRASKWKLYGNISQRNSTDVVQYPLSRYRASGTDGGFSHIVNDVTMTVLPNAPIDDATGLPVPTIAVGTGIAGAANGGVSVIKDDGSVVDITAGTGAGGYASYNVEFGSNNELIHTQAYNNSYASVNIFDAIPSSDISASNSYSAARSYLYVNGVPDLRGGVNGGSTPNLEYVSKSSNGDIAFGFQNTDAKLSLLSEPKNVGTSNQYSAVAYITSDYNTGWMQGHIKGAFLSDTTTESLTANTNLASACVQDGTSRLSSETYTNGATSWQMVDNAGSANGYVVVAFKGLTVGQSYIISMTWDNNATLDSGYNHRIAHLNGQAGENATNLTHWNKTNGSSETLTGVFTAQSTDNDDLVMYANAITLNVSNFILRAVDDEDRSRNKKGLQVFGTITKQPVATGAELVSYGPFSNSNYLEQPYNSDLNFGTGDYYFTYWMNSPSISSDQSIFQQGDYSQDKGINTLVWNSSGSGNSLQVGDGSANIVVEGHENAGWIQIFAVRKDGRLSVYKNGILQGTAGSSRNINYSSSSHNKSLVIGAMYSNGSLGFPYSGDLALFRVGASAPSAEQVKKIYEDEKHLFQENAKATLYGSSNAVTGLAHDDSTDTLHVGTSSGRSEFQGLCRINNTTEAVTTAISASNGLIAEQ